MTACRNNIVLDAFKRDLNINFVEWSNDFRFLPQESSIEPGKYRVDRVPYVRDILYELSPQSPTQKVVVVKGTQMGLTELGNNFLFAIADLFPGPAMMVFPTDDMAKRHSKKKVMPSVLATPRLKNKIKEHKSRDSGNTILLKEFPGGSWTFTGSNSPASARSDSVRYLILDDVDGFVLDAGGEGSPIDLFIRRTDAFGKRKKIYINSTPTVKGFSAIEYEYNKTSQGKFMCPCPLCGAYQYFDFGDSETSYGIKFNFGKGRTISDVWYQCEGCHGKILEHKKADFLVKGVYDHAYPDVADKGFKIPSFYSPLGWLSWGQIAKEFLAAKDNPQKLQVWVNTRRAETWEEPGHKFEWVDLMHKCGDYHKMTCPIGNVIITAGVDTQDNRVAIVVRAWGEGEESWLLYHDELYGTPGDTVLWEQVDKILYKNWECGNKLIKISAMAIDSGGHFTQDVYNYARFRYPVVMAIKGSRDKKAAIIGTPSKVDIDYLGTKIKGGCELWNIGTDSAKNTIYGRIALDGDGPGRYHWYNGTTEEYFRQLTAEKILTRYVKGYPVQEWHNVRGNKRNEVLDCEVYCYAAAIRSGISIHDFSQKNDVRSPIIKKRPKQKQGSWIQKNKIAGRGGGRWLNT